jgi:hypothetical protein
MECAYYFIPGGRHMECAYYFIPGGRHMECAYYFDFCRLCPLRLATKSGWAISPVTAVAERFAGRR